MELLRSLRELARDSGAWNDGEVRRRVGHLGAELDALWALARRNVSQAARTGVPGIGGSVYTLALSELRQRIAELGMDLIGSDGLVFADLPGDDSVVGNAEIVHTWVHSFSRTIAAGTSQIQRNIIAERILGLPKG
jgi:alkylation response protein AidB-like acyl-CoA dehydrogenase